MADRDFVVKNGLRTVGNSFVANSTQVTVTANLVIDNVAFIANGGAGSAGQYLTSNGSTVYWVSPSPGVNTAAQYAFTNTISFSGPIVSTNTFSANGGVGSAGQVLTSAGTGANVYWSTISGVNTAAQYAFSNTISSNSLLSLTGNVAVNSNIFANGAAGSSGQVLTSAGSGSNVYWSTVTGVNTATAYSFSNIITFQNGTAIQKAITANNSSNGTAGQVLASGGNTGNVYWTTVSAVSAGGSNTQIQFNDSTSFAGSGGFTFDKSTNNVTIANTLTLGGGATVNSTTFSGTALTANNSTNLGGVGSASYVNTSGSYTLGGNITLSGNLSIAKVLTANGTIGNAGQALISANTANAYWGNVVLSVGVTSPIVLGGTATAPTFSFANSGVTAATYTLATVTVDQFGRITSASSGTAGVTSVASANLSRISVGGTSSAPTVDLATSGPGSGTYGTSGVAAVSVDAYGRVTSVTTGSYLVNTSIGGTSGRIGVVANSTGATIDLATSGPGAATYGSGVSAIQVDAYGRVVSVTNNANYGTGTVTSVASGNGLSGGTITGTGTISINAPSNTTVGGLVSNTSGLFVNANTGLVANSQGLFLSNTGTSGARSGGISAITTDGQGRVTAVTGSAGYLTSAVTSVATGNGVTGGTITGTGTISVLANTGLVANSQGLFLSNTGTAGARSGGISAITTDGQGRVTAVTGSAGYLTSAVTSVGSGNGLTGGAITTTGTLSVLANTGIVANSTGVHNSYTATGTGSSLNAFVNNLYAAAEVYAYYTSDQTLKNNVVVIDNPIERIKAIRGVEFDWAEQYLADQGGEDGYHIRKHDVGVIAQEVEKVLPEVVATRSNGLKAVRYDKIVPLLIEAIKDLSNQVNELKNKINDMENK